MNPDTDTSQTKPAIAKRTVDKNVRLSDELGFLDIDLDPTLDLFSEIEKLKKI